MQIMNLILQEQLQKLMNGQLSKEDDYHNKIQWVEDKENKKVDKGLISMPNFPIQMVDGDNSISISIANNVEKRCQKSTQNEG